MNVWTLDSQDRTLDIAPSKLYKCCKMPWNQLVLAFAKHVHYTS